jgi:serine/threonine-protein kinase
LNEHLNDGFRLGEVLVQPLRGQVTSHNGSRHLAPKAVEVLLCLAARPGEVVTRSELLGKVWGDGHGSQEALSHAVSALRNAFDDHPDNPRYIQTLPRQGYRLLLEPQRPDATDGDEWQRSRLHVRKDGFLRELKRRGVLETGLAYVVFGWLIMQVVDVTFEPLLLPRWLGTFVTVLVIAGFPIALVLAWFIEIVEGRAVLDRRRAARTTRNVVSRTYVAVVGALLLASAGVYSYDYFIGLPSVETPGTATTHKDIALETPVEANAIAVLPFLNIDGSEESRIFAEGLAEDLINRLAKVPSLRVSSSRDSFSLPPNAGSGEVRQRLRVSYYLEGSVRLIAKRLRVVVQLINSQSGFHLLSRSFDRDRREFFAMQDEIAGLTVSNLRVALPPETQIILDTPGESPNLDAYLVYRRGMNALHRPMTNDSIREALDWFTEALKIDPEYAAAYAGMCTTYVSGFDVIGKAEYIDEAEKSCAAALSRNPNLDIVHTALGDLYFRTGRHDQAESAYERALSINVNNVDALTGLAAIYHRDQRLQLAEEKYRQAIGLQPGNWRTYDTFGTYLYNSGRYEEAAENYRRVLSLDASNSQGYSKLGAALMLSGKFAEAAPAFLRSIEILPQRDSYSNLGMMYYYLGQMDDAVAALRQAAEMAPNDHLTWSNLGDALSFTGHTGQADAAFRKAEELAQRRLSVNASDADTLVDLAWIKSMLDKLQDARELMATAKQLDPTNPYVHYISALILVKSGETSAAYDELEAAVTMGFPLEILAAEPHLRALKGQEKFVALTAAPSVR